MTFAPRLSAAGMAHLRQQLTARDWAVLEDVARCRLLTGRQLQLLHFGTDETSARAVRRLLARLAQQRILARLSRRIGGVRAGSSGYVYGLGVIGHRLLHPDRPGRPLHEVKDGFLMHTLAISDVYVSLRQAEQRGSLELLRVELEPQCWRRLDSVNGADWLKPDMHVVFGIGDEALHSFVEVDRGTEHSPALLRKLKQYETAYRIGSIEAAAGVFPRVVWVVPTEARATLLRRLIRSHGVTADLHAITLQSSALTVLAGGSDTNTDPTTVPNK
jgi:Replication-relaxation